ncbi:MAG: single-stranded DNA-binding protein [Verrucomicrobia bacterium]|nr:MAG: single-stranded DNA-binding protein [Verrucomicrobiota bacterium]
MTPEVTRELLLAAKRLSSEVSRLKFSTPVSHVYNPLVYAWPVYESYLRRFAGGHKRVVFLGMNPGPFGMAQTGVPFGEVAAVRNWLGLAGSIGKPPREHPRRPVRGFDCSRSEVSGNRLWGLFAQEFETPTKFFKTHLVMNYCPLAFIEESGRNRTPDKLAPAERETLFEACDAHLLRVVRILQPEWLIGIGDFAFKRAAAVFSNGHSPSGPGVRSHNPAPKLGRVLHPSPASPTANRNWAGLAREQLRQSGVWQ